MRHGFSKERRLDPQITIGLLTDATGFPLMLQLLVQESGEVVRAEPVI